MKELLYSSEKPYVRAYRVTFLDQEAEWYKVLLGKGKYRRIFDRMSKDNFEDMMEFVDDIVKGDEGEYLDEGYGPLLSGFGVQGNKEVDEDTGSVPWGPTIIRTYPEKIQEERNLVSGVKGSHTPWTGIVEYQGPRKYAALVLGHEYSHKLRDKKHGTRIVLEDLEQGRYDEEKQVWLDTKRRMQQSGSWDDDQEAVAAYFLASYEADPRLKYQSEKDVRIKAGPFLKALEQFKD